ncbi:MAG: prepilin-type N-terminal cleavage/methylation domain-containing protein [Phycisphaerae bacterium]|nr:prepilin-type N-terminal cleavage/methylation domain-containing protein [Phycisphaerae bacterium]
MILRRHHVRRRGLTLVELLVVISIIVVIGAMVCYALWKLYRAVRTMFAGAGLPDAAALVVAAGPSDGPRNG